MFVHGIAATWAVGIALLGPTVPAPRDLGPRPPGLAPIEHQPMTTPRSERTGASAVEDGPASKQRAVALGLFADDLSFSYAPLLREIGALGATHVTLIVPLFQTDAKAIDLALHTRWSPTLEVVADAVRAARREHLEVTVSPLIRLLRPAKGDRRERLAPANRDAWFRNYAEIVGDLAAVAAQTGATRFVLASELSSLDDDLARWRPLVERLRAVFPGKLVASASAAHYRDSKLFELVDEENVVASFPLRANAAAPATDAAFDSAWRGHQAELLRWHEAKGREAKGNDGRARPLTLTVGYRSRAGSTVAPDDDAAGGTPDAEEQRRAFAAFRRIWAGEPRLEGITIWNWYGWGGAASVGYTPRGKPAEQEVRKLLEGL